MAENLNYAASGSKCGGSDGNLKDENTEICDTYGRLYDWATAKTACPTGWHLPSNGEWDDLMTAVGGSSTAGTKLKAANASGWNGTDDYGFSALPGGYGRSSGDFFYVGSNGYWWSASEYSADYAYYRGMNSNGTNVSKDYYGKAFLYSVRCVQD
jgi:uncharacterized protein (TIGR02145 family)